MHAVCCRLHCSVEFEFRSFRWNSQRSKSTRATCRRVIDIENATEIFIARYFVKKRSTVNAVWSCRVSSFLWSLYTFGHICALILVFEFLRKNVDESGAFIRRACRRMPRDQSQNYSKPFDFFEPIGLPHLLCGLQFNTINFCSWEAVSITPQQWYYTWDIAIVVPLGNDCNMHASEVRGIAVKLAWLPCSINWYSVKILSNLTTRACVFPSWCVLEI